MVVGGGCSLFFHIKQEQDEKESHLSFEPFLTWKNWKKSHRIERETTLQLDSGLLSFLFVVFQSTSPLLPCLNEKGGSNQVHQKEGLVLRDVSAINGTHLLVNPVLIRPKGV